MAHRVPLVLLACGSFNPITYQHMRLFELARDHMQHTGLYQVVGGIVSPVSDKYAKQGLVSSKHRLAMARLALQSSDWVSADDWESQQADWTETVVTMRYHYNHLIEQYSTSTKDTPPQHLPTSASPQLKLLCGADVLETFRVPGLWREDHVKELLERFGLVCVSRGDLRPERTVHESDLLSKHRHNIFLVREWFHNEISSTEVRRALRRGLSVRYLLPDPVIRYIREQQLYTQESELRNKGTKLRPLSKNTQD